MNRLLIGRGGSGSFLPPPPPIEAVLGGPYDPAFTPGATVLTQVHCHTTQSDGSFSPASVVSQYLAKGYGALAITDHDKATTQPAGITTVIPGNEYSPTTQHIIGMNTTYLRSGATNAQTIIDAVTGVGGQVEVAHPNWSTGMTYAELAALTGHLGFEIHNAKCINGVGQNPVTFGGYAVERWDQVLTNVNRATWGFAVDDLHFIDAFNDLDVGRLQVFAASNTLSDLMAALVAGNFVADVSNYGVTPAYPELDPTGISLDCTGATRIEAWGAGGLLSSSAGTSHTHDFDGSESYVRMVAIGGYTETFGSALSDRWRAVDGTWTVGSGVLSLSSDATARRLILRRHRQTDFTAQVDVKLGSGGTDGAALMFNVLNGNYYYILRIGESTQPAYSNQLAVGKTTGNSFTGSPLGSFAFDPTSGTWYTLKLAYTAATGRIRAKVWEVATTEPDWQIDVNDTSWRWGGFGFRANRSAQYDNLAIDGFQTFYQPVSVDLA